MAVALLSGHPYVTNSTNMEGNWHRFNYGHILGHVFRILNATT